MTLGRALLFCPADRPDRFAKAAAAADAIILDFEDAVGADRKTFAHECVTASDLDPASVIVRLNPVGSPFHLLDVLTVVSTPYRTVMLAKTEEKSHLDALHDAGFSVIALCETAKGVQNAATIARHPAVAALMWGAEDLVASMGGRSSRNSAGAYRDVARAARFRVLLAAHAAGKDAIDAVHLDIPDLDGLAAEAEDAAASGFSATACIHPSQVATIRRAYAPTETEIAWATQVIHASRNQSGVFVLQGSMIDEPLLRQARVILEAMIQRDPAR
ncbi:HpcH/HpaI aldolase/citrate lyase family protein [Leifsonia sp. NPDC056665]|uniref:HpcH/HpaI aldolase/citrate lyase family protein n=1 Tax=Leifsonia sp. NPDC056665 TaxID=3345901 RepID=UPI0036894654